MSKESIQNPHSIVLNQILNFSQSTFNKLSQNYENGASQEVKEHWAAVEQSFRDFVEGLKMFELLDINSRMDEEIRNKISDLLSMMQTVDNHDINEISRFINHQ